METPRINSWRLYATRNQTQLSPYPRVFISTRHHQTKPTNRTHIKPYDSMQTTSPAEMEAVTPCCSFSGMRQSVSRTCGQAFGKILFTCKSVVTNGSVLRPIGLPANSFVSPKHVAEKHTKSSACSPLTRLFLFRGLRTALSFADVFWRCAHWTSPRMSTTSRNARPPSSPTPARANKRMIRTRTAMRARRNRWRMKTVRNCFSLFSLSVSV